MVMCFMGLSICSGLSAAQTNILPDGEYVEPYSLRYEYIISGIKDGENADQYIERLSSRLYKKRDFITQDDADLVRKQHFEVERNLLKIRLSKHDINKDKKITLDELKKSVVSEHVPDKSYIYIQEQSVKGLLKYDHDNDLVISGDELDEPYDYSSSYSYHKKDRLRIYEEYLYFDPNGDGTLYKEEFTKLARDIFSLADVNKDGIFSKDDKVKYSVGDFSTQCILFDDISESDFSVHMAAIEGYSIDESLGFQIDNSGKSTWYTKIIVNKPNENVALILDGSEPYIWEVVKTEGTNIVAIVLTGHHTNILLGLDETVTVFKNSYDKLREQV